MTENSAAAEPNPGLKVSNLRCERGGRALFSGLSFALEPGQLLRISGKNGSGKSSLLRILCGLLAPADGQVLWRGKPITQDRESFHAELIYLGHMPALKNDLSAVENLVVAAALSGSAATHLDARAAIEASGLAPLASRMVRAMSQGQKQRVALARLGLTPAKPLWLLDEPFNALDQDANLALQDRIMGHVQSGGIVVLSSHQPLAIDKSPCVVGVQL